MEFSTAKWTATILGFIAVVSITTYFILDEKDLMIPALSASIFPIMTLTMVPVIFLLGAILMARSKKRGAHHAKKCSKGIGTYRLSCSL